MGTHDEKIDIFEAESDTGRDTLAQEKAGVVGIVWGGQQQHLSNRPGYEECGKISFSLSVSSLVQSGVIFKEGENNNKYICY